MGSPRFIAFVVVTLVVFVGILALVMRGRAAPTSRGAVASVCLVVVVFVSSPVIHVVFSFVLGWHDYLPFFHVPWWRDLVR